MSTQVPNPANTSGSDFCAACALNGHEREGSGAAIEASASRRTGRSVRSLV